jgi:hypothetical protein
MLMALVDYGVWLYCSMFGGHAFSKPLILLYSILIFSMKAPTVFAVVLIGRTIAR